MRSQSPPPHRVSHRVCALALFALCVPAAACADRASSPGQATARLEIAVAPLALDAVTEASFNLRARNGDGALIWERLGMSSSRFGNGRGDLAYVGPCDAQVNPNRVELELVDLTGPPPGSWQNPAPPGSPVFIDVVCLENADVPVSFNLTILRDAQQGFFDIGVDFDNIFCSAKFDCRDEDNQPLEFLHDPATGERAETAIMALACTTGDGRETEIYRSDVRITCIDGTTYNFSPTAGIGNTGAQSPGIFQSAIYAGRESLPGLNKCYWNMAFGLDLTGLGPGCTLTASATASATPFSGGAIPAGHVWPIITWQVPLTDLEGALACGRSPLNGGDGRVTTTYTTGEGLSFSRLLDCQTERFDNPGAIACNGQIQVDAEGLAVEALTADGSVTLVAGGASSGRLALPAGLAVGGCCAAPCCQ